MVKHFNFQLRTVQQYRARFKKDNTDYLIGEEQKVVGALI